MSPSFSTLVTAITEIHCLRGSEQLLLAKLQSGTETEGTIFEPGYIKYQYPSTLYGIYYLRVVGYILVYIHIQPNLCKLNPQELSSSLWLSLYRKKKILGGQNVEKDLSHWSN